MNVLELVRKSTKKEQALKQAQKQLCYRGVTYTQQASKAS